MKIPVGSTVQGKWTAMTFIVERLLGEGANGAVYLVRTSKGRAALKVCEKAGDIAMEWALLDGLRGQSALPKPMLIDDDATRPNVFFYVMEWIPGKPLGEVLQHSDEACFYQIVIQLLDGLHQLHQTGRVFCDMKPENILISTAPAIEARFVDVGGVTPIGRAVRQFTPYNDRAFWGLGSRQADPAYDICGLALGIVLSCVGTPPQQLLSRTPSERRQWLHKAILRFSFPQYIDFLTKAVSTSSIDAQTAMAMVKQAHQTPAQARRTKMKHTQSAKSRSTSNAQPKHRHRRPTASKVDWTEWVMWASLCCSVFATVAAWVSFLAW